MTRSVLLVRWLAPLALFSLSVFSCGRSDPGSTPAVDPALGASEFISAGTSPLRGGSADSQASGTGTASAEGVQPSVAPNDSAAAPGPGGATQVEEGDIYRLLGDHLLLNLNQYRGLQVIDIKDVSKPEIIGRLPIWGAPVEMYLVDTRAIVLLNGYRNYYGSRDDVSLQAYEGGLVVSVDLADPAAPKLVSQARVAGSIQTSRLTRGPGMTALYVAANRWEQESKTVVQSFSVSAAGQLVAATALDLGGYVRDIQATPRALLVARQKPEVAGNLWMGERSSVTLIDISSPDGTMVQGAEIPVSGQIQHKTNMDLNKSILRVVSAGSWSAGRINHLETFEVTDFKNPKVLDHDTFGKEEDLYATLFLGNKAFFVTYFRTDPFHAFEIDDLGRAVEKNEYVISGWNDFFKPVFQDSRLIGIGVNDQNGSRTMAVSLYDVSSLTNPNPFLARQEVAADHSWSEATFDDKAFSVLENAVSIPATQGSATETGMVLLPFTGYNQDQGAYVAAVQIFTFSAKTLSRRGIMSHGTTVRRSFLANPAAVANLSEAELTLFDHADPAAPKEKGRLALAPDYTDFFVYGGYGARLRYDSDGYSWWGPLARKPDNALEIIPLAEHPDTAKPVAQVAIGANAQVFQVGALAVAVEARWTADSPEGKPRYEVELQATDLTDAAHPVKSGHLLTSDLPASVGGGGPMPMMDLVAPACLGCGRGSPSYVHALVVGTSLVFPSYVYESEIVGSERVCTTYPKSMAGGAIEPAAPPVASGSSPGSTGGGSAPSAPSADTIQEYDGGGITCVSIDGGKPQCSGELVHCRSGQDGRMQCDPVEPGGIQTTTQCQTYPRQRSWQRLELNLVDFSNPGEPVVRHVASLPRHEEVASLLVKGSELIESYSIPHQVAFDPRSFVRYYFRAIGLADPAAPVVGKGINVPGVLLELEGDRIFTHDFVWAEGWQIESALNKLQVKGGKAYLQARLRFEGRSVVAMLLDGQGHALVSHREGSSSGGVAASGGVAVDAAPAISSAMPGPGVVRPDPIQMPKDTLSILDVAGDRFGVLAELEIDQWAALRDARENRALFEVPGGILVVNLDDPARPKAQAFFPVMGWPQSLLIQGGNAIVAAGRYGMYRFPLDLVNLSAP